MGQAQIYWDMEQYSKVQSILQQSADFCSEHEAWKLNSAHAHFMQGGRLHHFTTKLMLCGSVACASVSAVAVCLVAWSRDLAATDTE